MRRLRQEIASQLLAGAIAMLAYNGCSSSDNAADGGGGDLAASEQCLGGADQSVNIDTAEALTAGQATTGYVCPRGDTDFYKVSVPAGEKLLRVTLEPTTTLSNVALTYLLLKRQQPDANQVNQRTVATPPPRGASGFDARHCLRPSEPDLEPGVFYLLVQDEGNDAADGKNPYKLTVTTEADPDTNEDNDSRASATAIKGSASGYIACSEDIDYYAVDVQDNQLLQIDLLTASASSVDLKYQLLDNQGDLVAEESNPDGTKGATALGAIHATPGAGKYFVAISDLGSNEGDPQAAYELKVGTVAENDPQDQVGNNKRRNDTPEHATTLSLGGGTLERTFTGQIGSKGDVDYFRIDGLGNAGTNNPAVMEVTVTFAGQTTVDPSFTYLYGTKGSPCTRDACCRVINTQPNTCLSWRDCRRTSSTCITRGETFCADAECAPNAELGCENQRQCAGAALCLPNKLCAVEYASRWNQDGGTARTSQLLPKDGPWYVRVGDHQNDEYDHGKDYTVTIRARMDPDGTAELDNELFTDLCLLTVPPVTSSDDTRDMHFSVAKAKDKQINWGQTVSGYLSYEGDIDWYHLPNPCPDDDCILKIDFSTGPGCPTTGAQKRRCEGSGAPDAPGLEFLYTLRRSKGGGWSGFQADAGQSGCWGDCGGGGQCFYSYKGHGSSDYWFTVEDRNNNSWSWTCGYTFTLSVTKQGCQAPCTTHPVSGNCDTP